MFDGKGCPQRAYTFPLNHCNMIYMHIMGISRIVLLGRMGDVVIFPNPCCLVTSSWISGGNARQIQVDDIMGSQSKSIKKVWRSSSGLYKDKMILSHYLMWQLKGFHKNLPLGGESQKLGEVSIETVLYQIESPDEWLFDQASHGRKQVGPDRELENLQLFHYIRLIVMARLHVGKPHMVEGVSLVI